MAVVKLLNLLALSCLAIIASLGPAPVAALSVDTHLPRHNLHHAIAVKKKRGTSKRCKPRATAAPKPSKAAPAPQPTKASNSGSGGSDSGSNGSNSGSDNGNGASKAGIAWSLGNSPALGNLKTWKTSKYYTWSPWCVDDKNARGLKCCPMLWGAKQTADFSKLVKPGYAECAMGFNEPNQEGQAQMSVGEGIDLWRKSLDPLKDQGYYLVSPACTNAPSGKTWMKGFLDGCKGCHIDAVALHYYGTDAKEMINYITDFYNTFKKPIWVTEYACQDFSYQKKCDWDKVFSFMREVTTFMDNSSQVGAYFAFGFGDMSNVDPVNTLMGSDGKLTSLGRAYIGD